VIGPFTVITLEPVFVPSPFVMGEGKGGGVLATASIGYWLLLEENAALALRSPKEPTLSFFS